MHLVTSGAQQHHGGRLRRFGQAPQSGGHVSFWGSPVAVAGGFRHRLPGLRGDAFRGGGLEFGAQINLPGKDGEGEDVQERLRDQN